MAIPIVTYLPIVKETGPATTTALATIAAAGTATSRGKKWLQSIRQQMPESHPLALAVPGILCQRLMVVSEKSNLLNKQDLAAAGS